MRELKTILREMVLELGELKEKVAALERAQQRPDGFRPGSGQAADAAHGEPPEGTLTGAADPPGDPPAAAFLGSLEEMYREGYHICPMAFSEKRTGGCLFCAAMLARGEA